MHEQDKLIRLSDAVTAIKGMYEVLGPAGTKAAVMVLEGLPEANGWISVEERLPKCDQSVLVRDGSSVFIYTLLYHNDRSDGCLPGYVWEDDYGYWQALENVTHWMPLPWEEE